MTLKFQMGLVTPLNKKAYEKKMLNEKSNQTGQSVLEIPYDIYILSLIYNLHVSANYEGVYSSSKISSVNRRDKKKLITTL